MRFTKHLAGLATTTALLASGPFVAHADAAPPGAVAGATAPIATVVAPPATGDYNLTTLSGTTAQLVGRGAYAGITADVQVVEGSVDTANARNPWDDLLAWLKKMFRVDRPARCGITIDTSGTDIGILKVECHPA